MMNTIYFFKCEGVTFAKIVKYTDQCWEKSAYNLAASLHKLTQKQHNYKTELNYPVFRVSPGQATNETRNH